MSLLVTIIMVAVFQLGSILVNINYTDRIHTARQCLNEKTANFKEDKLVKKMSRLGKKEIIKSSIFDY